MSTFSIKPSEIDKKWVIIDATNLVVGRLASIVAMRLRGKHLPTYTQHMDMGDNVVIINAEKVQADRPQARSARVPLAHRLSRRHQGPDPAPAARRPSPRARARECGAPHDPERSARPRPAPQSARLRRCRAPACRPAARDARRRHHELQECAGEVIWPIPSTPSKTSAPQPAPCLRRARLRPEDRCPGPLLRHRQAQERDRPRLGEARQRQDHDQRQGLQRLLRPSRCSR